MFLKRLNLFRAWGEYFKIFIFIFPKTLTLSKMYNDIILYNPNYFTVRMIFTPLITY